MHVARTLFGAAMSGALVLSACKTAPDLNAGEAGADAVAPDIAGARSLPVVTVVQAGDPHTGAPPA